MKMLLNFSEGIIMASLTLIVPECMVATLAALSAFHLYRGLSVARFYKNAKEQADDDDEEDGYPVQISSDKRPAIEYEDSGQKYMYIIRAGERVVKCFSDNMYCNPDDITRVIQTVEDDGKISIEDNSDVAVEVMGRKDPL